jgi:hypothetical protein
MEHQDQIGALNTIPCLQKWPLSGEVDPWASSCPERDPGRLTTQVVSPEELVTHIKGLGLARCQWLRPETLATQESEIRRLQFKASPRQIVHKTLSKKKKNHKKGLVE